MICLVAALVSYVGALAARSDSSIGIRTVEWLRDNGARGLGPVQELALGTDEWLGVSGAAGSPR